VVDQKGNNRDFLEGHRKSNRGEDTVEKTRKMNRQVERAFFCSEAPLERTRIHSEE
jgi:hypothetical protein